MNIFEMLDQVLQEPLGVLYFVAFLIISTCVLIILLAILINFIGSKNSGKVKKEKKSVVETGTMLLFFVGFYLILRFRLGVIEFDNFPLKASLVGLGLAVIILGTVVNIKGRFKLGKNWANQIKIYSKHTLVTTGVYGIVRHPLYASLIWMFYAASLVYFSWVAALANTLIFIPFMYMRAKQEEKLLLKQFKNYKDYQKSVGMFFPRLFKK